MMENWLSLRWFGWEALGSFYWAHPYFLYAIPAIPLAFLLRTAFHRRSRQFLTIPYDAIETPNDWLTRLRYVQPVSIALALTFILLALARPQIITERTDRFSEGIDIMLLVDVSDSMLEKDLNPDRLTAAKQVARNFVRGRLQDRIGIIVFAGEAYSLCPLTTDYDLLYGFLEDLKPDMIRTAGTAIGSALAVGVNRMRDSRSQSKVAILISDGENTSGNLDPITAARLAKAFGVKIYTIAVGNTRRTSTGDTLKIAAAQVDEGELQEIAAAGDGKYFRATDNTALVKVFTQINKMEKVQFKNVVFREVKDYYRVYLYWAVLLIILALATKSTFMSNILED
ncbi:VWA domain-containing protein [Persicitalea jodogahamensis]|uniref:Aerotolerance protein BatA n=1 Tax=Persicitalea jodogahamensis TaxID=402147 RepID=A0A8J3D8D1_9BACT|nr:VWA domain-containing protein [Persicitalea jodogahamensis]GHB67807.1 aerotolerance protein BatA [Persicitalea jodogahamensis]